MRTTEELRDALAGRVGWPGRGRNSNIRPIQVDDREHLRLRDEWSTGHRVVVRDRDDGLPGVTLAVVATSVDYLAADLDLDDIGSLIAALTRLVDRDLIADCPWCDTLGLVDGDDGIEFCQHPVACDAG